MERSLLIITTIVLIVGVVGVITILPPQDFDATGNVVKEDASGCSACEGTPVCAGKYGRALTYSSACHARCDGADIIYADRCERIPRAA